MGNIWNKFDYKILLCCTKYKNRYRGARKELERVGLSDAVDFFDFDSPLKDILHARIKCDKQLYNKIGSFSCCLAHYRAIATAYQLGVERVLIMEDDIGFHKDLRFIQECIDTLPDDFDYAQFEHVKPYNMSRDEYFSLKHQNKVSRYWRRFSNLRGGCCYALSRSGMEGMIEEIEHCIATNIPLKINDFYCSVLPNLDKYFCYPNVAVQCVLGESNANTAKYWEDYRTDGIDIMAYEDRRDERMEEITRGNFIQSLGDYINRENKDDRIQDIGSIYSKWDYKPSVRIIFPTDRFKRDLRMPDAFLIWGYSLSEANIRTLNQYIQGGARGKLLFLEPGFISSLTTFADRASPSYYRIEHSVMIDTRAAFFDAFVETDLEMMLNGTKVIITPGQNAEARRLIDKIVSNKISKYNHQPIYTPKIGREGARKVLVIDQSYGDFSIKRGMADDSTFQKMLDSAIKENPDADILVKTHPDTIAGKKCEKKGYFQDLKEHDNIYKVTFPINPYSLMEVCDKIYVVSSQFGLEGLMAGKEVHVFGMPFYAGWGLTIDDQHLDRRTNMRTIEELFYIFYCMYTHWVDPDKGCETTIDAVIDKMIKLREEYQKHPPASPASTSDMCFGGYRLGPRTRPICLPRTGSVNRPFNPNSNW